MAETRDPRQWLINEAAARLALAIESMSGSPVTVKQQDAPAPSGDGVHWWEQGYSSLAGGFVWVGAGKPAWSAIGDAVLSAAGVPGADEADLLSTYREILQQTLAGLAQAFTSLFGREVTPESGRERDSAPADSPLVAFEADLGAGLLAYVSVAFAPALEKAVASALSPAAAPPAASASSEPSPGSGRPAGEDDETNRTLHLLYDVELPVSVSFGRAHLPLKEVLRLISGSIVELNRGVSEPVEVIVNNCVIARGEVVVVEGNYGVRIQQIVSRHERLRTLR